MLAPSELGEQLRYVGQAFERDGEWFRHGKLGPYPIVGPEDTSRLRLKRDDTCPACALDRPHSLLYHLQTV